MFENEIDSNESGYSNFDTDLQAPQEDSQTLEANVEAGDNESTPIISLDEQIVTNDPIFISYDVPLIPQPTAVSCWAAALAMVIAHRDYVSHTAEDIAAKANMDTAIGYRWNDISMAVSAWDAKEVGSACGLTDFWIDLLQTNGPLWIVEIGNPTHAVVITGMYGDGTLEGTTMLINNPWPPNQGEIQEKRFSEFEREFELGDPAKAMIVYK